MSLIKQKTINKLLINQVNEVKHIIFSFSDEYKFKFDNILKQINEKEKI